VYRTDRLLLPVSKHLHGHVISPIECTHPVFCFPLVLLQVLQRFQSLTLDRPSDLLTSRNDATLERLRSPVQSVCVLENIDFDYASVGPPCLLKAESPKQPCDSNPGALLSERLPRAHAAAPTEGHVATLSREWPGIFVAGQISPRVKLIWFRELALVVMYGPHVPLNPCPFGDEIPVASIVASGRMGLTW
jgi:hypothetical protein